MIHTRALAFGCLLSVAGFCSCALEVEDRAEQVDSKTSDVYYVTEDISFNVLGFLQMVLGRSLNGTDLNGTVLEGAHVASVQLDSARYRGEPMSDVKLEESVFGGRTAEGKQLKNKNFQDVEFDAITDTGAGIVLRLQSGQRSKDKGLNDIFLYDVVYGANEAPLCGVDESGEPIKAIALNGHWDYREGVEGGGSKIDDPATFTFACLGHVAAKCVQMGYNPWRRAVVCEGGEGCHIESIGHLHQACTRMMRGDYCGDGTTHTVEGTPLNAYDGYGIRYDGDDWDFESEWTVDGARCLQTPRLPSVDPLLLSCSNKLSVESCGELDHFLEGADLFSEVSPR